MNAAAHALHAATVVGGAHAIHDLRQHGQFTPMPLASGGLAALLGSLPDWIEPAYNPHHRQFFHSVTFLCGVGYVTYRVYRWQPDTPWQKLMKWLGVVAGGAYMVHLMCDARTPRGLPMLGRL